MVYFCCKIELKKESRYGRSRQPVLENEIFFETDIKLISQQMCRPFFVVSFFRYKRIEK